jgi:hypothetical protein
MALPERICPLQAAVVAVRLPVVAAVLVALLPRRVIYIIVAAFTQLLLVVLVLGLHPRLRLEQMAAIPRLLYHPLLLQTALAVVAAGLVVADLDLLQRVKTVVRAAAALTAIHQLRCKMAVLGHQVKVMQAQLV